MRSFLTKLRKWRGDRQHLEAAEDYRPIKATEVCEAERRAQRDEQKDQQAQALLLILSELQRIMDPAIATHVYNARFCPLLSRLPDELLLCISDFLSDDIVTLFCLRIVSRKLFHLLNRRKTIWGERHSFCQPLYLPCDGLLKFRPLLQRDNKCNNCRHWNDAQRPQTFDECKFQPTGEFITRILGEDMLYFYVCESAHYTCRFSSFYQQPLKHERDRRCLGQEGSVQLCEHIQTTWTRIKAYIDDCRQQQCGREDWRTCLESFNIECHDPIHDTRCTTSEAPTWPRARLGISRVNPDIVVLNIEWTPHRRIDALNLTVDGRMPATELRALFRGLRELGPADQIYPTSCRNSVPEMAFFSPSTSFGRFVYYETGEDDEIGPPPASLSPLPPHSWPRWRTSHGYGKNGTDIHINPHYIRDACHGVLSSQCLVVRYEKDIKICNTDAMAIPHIKINPSHAWLHAMDIRTYPHPQESHVRPLCRDTTCANYSERQRGRCIFNALDGYEI